MQPQRPVYWYSGQFLEPQHFQQADAFHASERASLLQSAQPCFWGVGNLDVDEAALAEGRILVRSGIMRFQDGTEVVIAAVPEDGNAILPSRSFREAWTDPHMPFTVFAGLPPLKPYGNVAGIPSCMRDGGRLIGCDADTLPEAPGRYLCPNSDDSIADRYALALHPDILCFDEPTSALDPELTGEVLRVLRDLADRKTTMIIVTHEMNFARDVADRILFMDGGVVVEQGPARQLIEHPQEERTKQFLAHYSE